MTCEICNFMINGMQHLDKSIRAKAISWRIASSSSRFLWFFLLFSFFLALLPAATVERFKVKLRSKNGTFFYYLLSSTSLNMRTMFRCKLWRESFFGCIAMCFVVANTSLTSSNSFFVNPMTLLNWFSRFLLFLTQKPLSFFFLPFKMELFRTRFNHLSIHGKY